MIILGEPAAEEERAGLEEDMRGWTQVPDDVIWKTEILCGMHGLGIMELYTTMARPRIGPWG